MHAHLSTSPLAENVTTTNGPTSQAALKKILEDVFLIIDSDDFSDDDSDDTLCTSEERLSSQ